MSAPLFDRAIAMVLKQEGGYVNDLHDPGLATNWGISLRFALAVGDLDRDGRPDLDLDGDGDVDADDIRALPREQAIELYRRHFWAPLRCDELPPALALAVFDCGVNQGRGPAVTFLQAALGVRTDGRLGPVTLGAARAAMVSHLLPRFLARRVYGAPRADGRWLPGYAGLAGWERYGFGWMVRTYAVYRAILGLEVTPE